MWVSWLVSLSPRYIDYWLRDNRFYWLRPSVNHRQQCASQQAYQKRQAQARYRMPGNELVKPFFLWRRWGNGVLPYMGLLPQGSGRFNCFCSVSRHAGHSRIPHRSGSYTRNSIQLGCQRLRIYLIQLGAFPGAADIGNNGIDQLPGTGRAPAKGTQYLILQHRQARFIGLGFGAIAPVFKLRGRLPNRGRVVGRLDIPDISGCFRPDNALQRIVGRRESGSSVTHLIGHTLGERPRRSSRQQHKKQKQAKHSRRH